MTLTTNIISNAKNVFERDPIIIKAATETSDVPAHTTMAQLVVEVTAHLPNNVAHIHEISQQFMPGDTVYADISSALQAEYQLWDRKEEPFPSVIQSLTTESAPTENFYQPFKVSIKAYIRYVVNGTEYDGSQNKVTVMEDIYILRGGLLPNHRRGLVSNPSAAVQAFAGMLTTKPRIPAGDVLHADNPSQHADTPILLEVKNIGDSHVASAYDKDSHRVTTKYTPVPAIETGMDQITPVSSIPLPICMIPESSPNRHQIIFRNSLGVLDTVSVFSRQKETLVIKSNDYQILSVPSYSPNQNVLNKNSFPSMQLDMSTGYVPSEWAEWFCQEVLTAEYVWMSFSYTNPKTGIPDKVYVPVRLVPDDKITVKDLTGTSIPEVNFEVIIEQKV